VTRPVVGITLGDGDRPGYQALREDYVRSVELADAVAVVLPAQRAEDAPALLERLDGLVLSGGVDIDPVLYGRTAHPKLGRVERRRDEFELALTREALARDLPLLAICRGHQLLNVACGGTLVQDIASELESDVTHDAAGRRTRRVHDVEVAPGSKLAEVLGAGSLSVNSFHHQAIEELGNGLRVSARSPRDGLIEGIEVDGRRFAIGVQWHPESFWRRPRSFQGLFDAHAAACRVPSLVGSR
jgi:putative glutamine amidotransferase